MQQVTEIYGGENGWDDSTQHRVADQMLIRGEPICFLIPASVAKRRARQPAKRQRVSDKPTTRPLKQKLKHSGILGDWIAEDLLEDGYNIRPVRKLVLTGT